MARELGVAPHEATHATGAGDAFLSTDVLEAVAKRLRETGGPTTLAMGSVADGEFLKRSGSSIVGGAAGGGGGRYSALLVKSSAYSIVNADSGALVVSSGSSVLTLPATPPAGFSIAVLVTDGGGSAIQVGGGTGTIYDGGTDITNTIGPTTVNPGAYVEIVTWNGGTNANWVVTSNHGGWVGT